MTLYGMKIDPAPLGPFNAEAWVRSRLRDAPTLQPVTLHAVAGFALIWNLFEGLVRDHRANVAQFERVVGRIGYSAELENAINDCLAFYRFRYVADGAVNTRFDGLHLRPNDRRPHVEATLKGEIASPADKMLAILIIAYRIRNNLFHGLKSVHSWDDQAANIAHAARVLSLAIEASGSYAVDRRNAI